MNRVFAAVSTLAIAAAAFVAGRHTAVQTAVEAHPARRVRYYVDPMHPSYRSDKPGTAPDCGMALEPVYEDQQETPLPAGAVSISAERQQLIGVNVEPVEWAPGSHTLHTGGRVEPEDARVYRITASTDGLVQSLEAIPPGTLVKKDQLLATFYSREFRNAQQAYLGSLGSLDRLRPGRDTDDQTRNSDASLRLNEEQLRTLGMGDPQIKELAKARQITRDIDIVSPANGIVLSRSISPSQRFEHGAEFYRIADLSKVWIVADVDAGQAASIRPGASAIISIRGLAKRLHATVAGALPLFDATSRTWRVRLETDNPDLLLRPDMFVDVELPLQSSGGISIPADAVLDSGMHKVVYVQTAKDVFQPRPVTIGGEVGDRVIIKTGLSAGDRVVTSGTFLIDSESRMTSAPLHTAEQQSRVKQSGAGQDHD